MIGWLYPVALAGLASIVGPIAVHLLRRHRAERLPFPSLRFVAPARTSSFRIRYPSDAALLFLRIAIVGFAAVALAQPFVTTAGRRQNWNDRLTRAIVIDPAVSTSQQATEAAAVESRTAHALHISGSSLRDALQAAVDALVATFPSRREIVVISSFPHGSLWAADLAAIPAPMGLRFISVDAPRPSRDFTGDTTLGAAGVSPRVQRIRATIDGTDVDLKDAPHGGDGLRLETSPAEAEVVLRAVARAGAPAPDPRQPLALTFVSGAAIPEKPASTFAPWMVRTVVRMQRDPVLAEAARVHVRLLPAAELPGIDVARNGNGVPVVGALPRGPELVVVLAAEPDDFLTAAALQSALVARRGEMRWDDHEIARIPASTLASWTRAPVVVDGENVRPLPPGDARWMWGIVLALLGVETLVRKRRSQPIQSGYANAA